MTTAKIPAGYQQVMPYLIVKDAPAFIAFMQDVFDAVEVMRHNREDGHTIMHAEIKLGESIIMAADSTDKYEPRTSGLFIYVPDADAAYAKALAAGATSIAPPADQTYGRSAGITDPFGNTWWITTSK